jgi:hypothetical protein
MQAISLGITRLTRTTSPLLAVEFLGTLETRSGEPLKVRGVYHSFDKEETILSLMEAVREEAIHGLHVIYGPLPPSLKEQVQVQIKSSTLSIGG